MQAMETKPGVLFVDDEKNFLYSIQRVLRSNKDIWDLYFATNVNDALDLLNAEKIDLIITDMNMPDKDGFDLINAVIGNPLLKDIPIIVLTGSGEDHLKSKALLMGATDLLNKPLDSTELFARIQNTMTMKRYQDQIKDQNRILEEKVRERTVELEDARLDILWRLAKAGEQRDDETGNHVIRVAHYCRMLANSMGFPAERSHMIFITSPLHDIGKIGIPDSILLKQGKLSADEEKMIRTHCQIGVDILLSHPHFLDSFLTQDREKTPQWKPKDNPFLKLAASMANGHHEWWDGSGYPQGLKGEDIPIECRIVAVADVYDALRSSRSYKPRYPHEQALDTMRIEAERHFDPVLFGIFEDRANEIREMYDRYLPSG